MESEIKFTIIKSNNMQTQTIKLSTGITTTIVNGTISVTMPGTENRSSKFKTLVQWFSK